MATWTEEEIQEDKASQFEDMHYTIECNTCGEIITTVLLSADFDRPGLIHGPESIQHSLEVHNATHYEAPIPICKECGERIPADNDAVWHYHPGKVIRGR